MQYDSIIIGSGAGGLATALCLAKAGQKVLVLEQHYVPGGWCHSFYLDGHRFSPGVHYIGLLDEGESTRRMYEALGVANDIIFFRMNPSAYEHCWIGNERFDIPAGLENFSSSLSKKFPSEKKRITKYLDLVRKVSHQLQLIPKMKGLWDNITIPFRTAQLGKYGLFSLGRVINWHIKDPVARQVLNIQCGDHGLPPSRASFPIHCAVMDHYINGGFYPMGGGGGIVKAFTTAIKKYGGEIRVSTKVKKILIQSGKKRVATGVMLESGEVIHAKHIISNADPHKTFLDFVGKEELSKKMISKLQKTKYSLTSIMLFLTVDMDVKKAGIDSGNIWYLNGHDMDSLYNQMVDDSVMDMEEFPGLFISCTTLKDPTSFNGRLHTFEIVTFIDYKTFEKYSQLEDYHSDEYISIKDRIIRKIMTSMEKIVPGISSRIVLSELGTPMTNEYYINGTRGNTYGTEKTFWQVGPFAFSRKSEIENLYLCGASVLAHGVSGATFSGVQTAASILKCRMEDLLKPQQGQQLRVYDAEDPATWPDWVMAKIEDKKRRFNRSLERAKKVSS